MNGGLKVTQLGLLFILVVAAVAYLVVSLTNLFSGTSPVWAVSTAPRRNRPSTVVFVVGG